MWLIGSGALALLGVMFVALLLALAIARRAARGVRRLATRREPPLFGVRPGARALDDAAELRTYPNRLAAIEEKLIERHSAVQEQLRVLQERRAEVETKDGRDDLTRKYADDIALLDRRAESMRRVIAMVWKTRAILLLRVHLAVSARRRPTLGPLPVPGAPPNDLARAAGTCHEAAIAVRFYLEDIDERTAAIENIVPTAPLSGEVDDAVRALVEAETEATRAAHKSLRDQMDRLADNLVWLGDHFSTLKVVDGAEEPPTDPVGKDGSAASLIEQVAAAMKGLNQLAGSVDHSVAAAAVAGLTADVSRLEEAGLEAEAEAEAELEVERLVGGFGR